MQPTQNTAIQAEHPSRRFDGAPETDADRRFFDLRESGYTGWINQDSDPVTKDGHPVVWPEEFDGCSVCGGTFSIGPSLSSICGTCSQAPTIGDDEQNDYPVVPSATPAITLRAAARYLDRHGWCQGSYFDQTARVFTPAACMVGALGFVCYGGPVEAPAQHFDDPGFAEFEQALAWLDEFLDQQWEQTTYQFNDAKGRLAIEAISALLGAAKMWDRINGGAA